MKKTLSIVLVSFIAGFANAQIGLEGIVVERFYVSDNADSLNADENFATYPLSVGSVTYRVYANLLPGYKVIQMFGSQAHTLNIETTTSFYNDPNYGFSTYQGTSVVNTKKHTTLIDSYLTVGGVASGLVGVLKVEDTDGNIGNLQGVLANEDASAGAPITGANGFDGLMPGTPILPNILGLTSELDVFDQTPGGVFTTNGGTIAALGGVEGVTASNHVLLGQFTTDGVFCFSLNLQIATPIEGESQIFVAESASGDEILDSTLTYCSNDIIDFVHESRFSKFNGMQLYPNPCENMITVKRDASLSNLTNLSITDLTGRVVYTTAFAALTEQINTSEFAKGIYMVRTENNGIVETLKFVKH